MRCFAEHSRIFKHQYGSSFVTNHQLQDIASRQRTYFFTGASKDISFRIQQLTILRQAIEKYEAEIVTALHHDLRKPETEAYTSDIGPVLHEIDRAVTQLTSWTKPKKVRTPFLLFPGSSYIYPEPFGSVLIIGAWNYPINLTLSPLVGAMAAGNCAVVKPSEVAPHTSWILAKIFEESFEPAYIAVVEGGVEETQALLTQHFDYLFFTGGTQVGKVVMEAAAKHLTPVTLELGGKNPCIVDSDADLEKAGRRIVWGKLFNAGQTCIAPDYLFVHTSIKQSLFAQIKKSITAFYGEDPSMSQDYGRIINERHFSRLSALLQEGNVVIGGQTHPEDLYIAPTVLDNISWNHAIMQDEIFGPLLPVLEYEDLDQLIGLLQTKPKPLALYFFSNNASRQDRIDLTATFVRRGKH